MDDQNRAQEPELYDCFFNLHRGVKTGHMPPPALARNGSLKGLSVLSLSKPIIHSQILYLRSTAGQVCTATSVWKWTLLK